MILFASWPVDWDCWGKKKASTNGHFSTSSTLALKKDESSEKNMLCMFQCQLMCRDAPWEKGGFFSSFFVDAILALDGVVVVLEDLCDRRGDGVNVC